MSNTPATTTNNEVVKKEPKTLKSLLQGNAVQKRFNELLGAKTQTFISSILQVSQNNNLLAQADPNTILNASITAAVLDLSIDPNLGQAYIVPYGTKAQFQIGWKGLVQLAKRSGQYLKINVIEVYENQFKSFNRLTEELDADFTIDGVGEVIGYVAYFKEKNGFEKTNFWSIEKVKKHASKYSQTYGKRNANGKLKNSPWNDEHQFDAMAMKTVLKNALNQYGTLSIEMQTAQFADQSVQTIEGEYEYVDNQPQPIVIKEATAEETQSAHFKELLQEIMSIEELQSMVESSDNFTAEELELIKQKREELTSKK